jgi:hypothetical protein
MENTTSVIYQITNEEIPNDRLINTENSRRSVSSISILPKYLISLLINLHLEITA